MNMTFQLSSSHFQPWELPPHPHPPNYIKPSPGTSVTPWPSTNTLIWQDKTNVVHVKKDVCIMCSLITDSPTHTHTHTCVFTLRGQWLLLGTGTKVSNKKIQYSKCTRSLTYQYIIEKRNRWQVIRPRTTIDSSGSASSAVSESSTYRCW